MKSTSRFTKIAVASGLVVASGAAVLGVTGFASAQVAQRSASVVAVAEPSGSVTNTDPTSPAGNTNAAGSPMVEGKNHQGHGPGKGHGQGGEAVATALGVTVEELKTELSSGKSIADVAKAKNVDIAKVIAAMTAQMKTHLAEEVASGKHTQAEADAKLAEFTANLDTMVNRVGPAGGKEGRGHGPRGGREGAPAGMPGAQNTSARA
jgi:hypothetical protein